MSHRANRQLRRCEQDFLPGIYRKVLARRSLSVLWPVNCRRGSEMTPFNTPFWAEFLRRRMSCKVVADDLAHALEMAHSRVAMQMVYPKCSAKPTKSVGLSGSWLLRPTSHILDLIADKNLVAMPCIGTTPAE